jgi:hypothetical protein
MDMGRWRFCAVMLSLLWALAIVASKDKQKSPPFPLNLFAQAKPDHR